MLAPAVRRAPREPETTARGERFTHSAIAALSGWPRDASAHVPRTRRTALACGVDLLAMPIGPEQVYEVSLPHLGKMRTYQTPTRFCLGPDLLASGMAEVERMIENSRIYR